MNNENASDPQEKLDCLVALPAFNEEKAIGPLLEKTLALLPENSGILVVDDGSTDRTASIVQTFTTDHPVYLFAHDRNLGLAAAIRSLLTQGTRMLSDQGRLVIMDADASHLPEQIAELQQKLDQGFDVVIASRYTSSSQIQGVHPLRQLITTFSKHFFRLFLGELPAADLSCGFRMYRAQMLRSAFARFGDKLITVEGFCVTVEILVKLKWAGAKIAEIPLRLRYDLKESPSRMRFFHTSLEYIRLLTQLRSQRKQQQAIPAKKE